VAVRQICAAVTDADLIVLGAHGWEQLKQLLFGSMSSGVLHDAPCPVLVVRGVAEGETEELVGAAHAESH
jgi:nucleotide-binding universal stress UspA family protein